MATQCKLRNTALNQMSGFSTHQKLAERFFAKTTGDITRGIKREIRHIQREVPEVLGIYGFGSFFRGQEFNDIDIIFVLRCEFGRILPASKKLRGMVLNLSAVFGETFHSLILTEGEFEGHPLRDMHELIRISEPLNSCSGDVN